MLGVVRAVGTSGRGFGFLSEGGFWGLLSDELLRGPECTDLLVKLFVLLELVAVDAAGVGEEDLLGSADEGHVLFDGIVIVCLDFW